MANLPADQLKTWVLRVYIHCEGCRKKVYKILRNIDGVYKTEIDSQQHKAIVTGSVTGDTLVQKLRKSGKHAEILSEKPPESKKKQSNKKKSDDDGDEPVVLKLEKEAEPKIVVPIETGENNSPPNSKNKKKKKKNKVSPNNETESQQPPPDDDDINNNNPSLDDDELPTMNGDESNKEQQSQIVSPVISDQMGYATPNNLPQPPYFGYYPTDPAYNGMSYNTSYPSSEASYYTPPVYGYAQSHPSAAPYYYNPAPYYRRSVFDDDQEAEADDGKGYCTIM
uniref:heavy metal-associated isoprenylated plant protein 35-like n=1 Tax=Erigeron canadensis TaxID=72917 RepID=UPI001CB90A64|nr:heavy metal-associated isoprenylated plant protein 35-like [Erigeron canadensis]